MKNGNMKQLFLYIFSVLIFYNTSFADCVSDLDIKYTPAKSRAYLEFTFSNPTKNKIKINQVLLLNTEKEIILVRKYEKFIIQPYTRRGPLWVGKDHFMRELVKNFSVECTYVSSQ